MEENTDFKYLQKLKFDTAEYKSFVYKLINNFRSVVLLIILIIAIGIYSFIELPRELNPEINIPIVSISVSLPGSSPRDIEQLIIEPIEKVVSPIEEVDYIEATASQSIGILIVYLKEGVDQNLVEDKIRTEIENVEFPEDASDPRVQSIDFNQIPVLQTSIVSDLDLLSLSKVAKNLELELEKSKFIKEVNLNGNLEERIYITLKLDNIQKYNLTPAQLINAIQASDINLPSGNYEINAIEYQIAIDNSFKSISDIRQLILNINGQSIPISELAEISLKPDPDFKNYLKYLEKGGKEKNSVEIGIFKTDEAKINEATTAAGEIIDKYLTENKDIKRIDISNETDNISTEFDSLINNFFQTIFLSFLVLFLFLGTRQAIVAAISIPLTLLSVFIVMLVSGISINFLSLFSILLALGLIVDNSIVIVSAFDSYKKTGKFNATQTALMVYKDFKIPILTSTLCTIWAFLPLLLSTGIIGEYIRSIPIIVSAGLVACAIITIFINLPLLVAFSTNMPGHIRKLFSILGYITVCIILYFSITSIFNQSPNTDSKNADLLNNFALLFSIIATIFLIYSIKKNRIKLGSNRFLSSTFKKINALDKGILNFAPVVNAYEKMLRNILFNKLEKYLVVAITAVLFIVSIIFAATGMLKTEFFPASDSELIYVNLKGPAGWTGEKLDPYINEATEIVSELNELEFVTVIKGGNVEADNGVSTANNYAYLIVKLVEKNARKISSLDITEELRSKLNERIDIESSAIQFSGGPPAGADIQVNLTGEDFTVLESLNNQIQSIIRNIDEVASVNTTLIQSSGQINIQLSSTELSRRQLSAQEVSLWLRSVISDTKVSEFTNAGDDDTQIFVDVDKDFNLSEIENLIVPSQSGSKFTLGEIAEITLEDSPSEITRRDGKRLISVLGFVKTGESATEVFNDKVKPKLEELEIPDGYEWNVGGVNEENQESVNSIISQMLLSFALILTTMVIQMNSFRKALLVLSIIPIAVAGVFFNFTVFGIPLSFPSLIGTLALFGIVVNNSILLIEKINQNHEIGLEYREGIIDACASRMEPIFFTTITNIVGLLPITLSDPLWQGLGGAIIAGLSFSGIIILFLLPVIYSWVFKPVQHRPIIHNTLH
jgi:multidrug efflux pump subunit AcrB